MCRKNLNYTEKTFIYFVHAQKKCVWLKTGQLKKISEANIAVTLRFGSYKLWPSC